MKTTTFNKIHCVGSLLAIQRAEGSRRYLSWALLIKRPVQRWGPYLHNTMEVFFKKKIQVLVLFLVCAFSFNFWDSLCSDIISVNGEAALYWIPPPLLHRAAEMQIPLSCLCFGMSPHIRLYILPHSASFYIRRNVLHPPPPSTLHCLLCGKASVPNTISFYPPILGLSLASDQVLKSCS